MTNRWIPDRKMGSASAVIWFIAVLLGLLLFVWASASRAHDSWISRGAHRNAAGEWCCGEGDCVVIPGNRITATDHGYAIVGFRPGPAGFNEFLYGKQDDREVNETVPYSEAQPSRDGQFWRCKRPDGSRRCFFAPPPKQS